MIIDLNHYHYHNFIIFNSISLIDSFIFFLDLKIDFNY